MHAYCDQIQGNGGGGGGGSNSSESNANSNSNAGTTVTLITPSSTPTNAMCLPDPAKMTGTPLDAAQQHNTQQQTHVTHNTSTAGNNNVLNGTYASICYGCNKVISERFLLKALDQLWHEDCLKCSCCDCRLGEVGSTLYTKANLILCKRDYLR